MNPYERAFWGFIFGDAFGVPVEFKQRDTFEIKEFTGFGTWNVPPGTWSDDSAMMLVTIDHLVKKSSMEDLQRAYCDWAYRGFWTYNKQPSFDVGATISEVLSRWETISLTETARNDALSNGNGALMRILPIAFITYGKDINEIFTIIDDYATLTHGHIRSTFCCLHYALVVHALLDGLSIYNSLERATNRTLTFFKDYPEELDNFIGIFNIEALEREDVQSSGYVIHTLEAVYWSLLNATSYYDTIHKAVHLGNDTDTIGALAGGLAGIYYPYLDTPTTWFSIIPRNGEIQTLIQQFIATIQK